jgi:hypothetical protein
MSKRYQYLAKKRGSHNYQLATGTCKSKIPNRFTICRVCLGRIGTTRCKQKNYDIKLK